MDQQKKKKSTENETLTVEQEKGEQGGRSGTEKESDKSEEVERKVRKDRRVKKLKSPIKNLTTITKGPKHYYPGETFTYTFDDSNIYEPKKNC